MSCVLAAIDDSAAAQPVLATAVALAPAFGATVAAVHVAEKVGDTAQAAATRFSVPLQVLSGDPFEIITSLAADPGVVAVVLGARGRPGGRRPAGHLALALADRLRKPIVMVPPDARPPAPVRTVLVAMEGSPTKTGSLCEAVRIASDAGLELVVVHVDDEASIPSFSDQVQHETDAYAREFLARHCPGATSARLESRVGVPADEIIAAVESVDPALVAVGWPQTDDPSRGAVAREVLDRSRIPVLLIAVS